MTKFSLVNNSVKDRLDKVSLLRVLFELAELIDIAITMGKSLTCTCGVNSS